MCMNMHLMHFHACVALYMHYVHAMCMNMHLMHFHACVALYMHYVHEHAPDAFSCCCIVHTHIAYMCLMCHMM